jgi:hypothetical protein
VELIPVLSTVVLVAILITLVLAVASYTVFRLRDVRKRRRESSGKEDEKAGPKYFKRHSPPESSGPGA